MAFDGLLLNKVVDGLNHEILGGKINKIYQVSNYEILFQVRTHHSTKQLLISCHPTYSRVSLSSLQYPRPELPNTFTMFLRKHLEGAYIKEIKQVSLERIICISFSTRNAFGDPIDLYAYIEIMGKHSNFILADKDNKILESLKRISASVSSVRIIYPGITYEYPPLQDFKKDIFKDKVIVTEDLYRQYIGLSPLTSKEIHYRYLHHESIDSILNEVKKSNSIYIYKNENKDIYSIIPLTHLTSEYKVYPLFEGLDTFYGSKDETDRIKQQTSNLVAFVDNEYSKNVNKLEKLESSLYDSENSEEYKVKGELLYTVIDQINRGMTEILVDNYYDGSVVKIDLDPKLDGKGNAKKYFHKYNKAKNAVNILKEQIELTKKEIDYFGELVTQLSYSNYYDALEIKEELETLGYLRRKVKQKSKQNKKPNYDTYVSSDGIDILVGKNNIQNDYLTFKVASYNHYWFHVKNMPGSHVVIRDTNPPENTIRQAATLAAFFSKARNSSSVAVDYTEVRNVRKLSGGKPGMVIFDKYKTIYVDPDEEVIDQIEKK